MDHATVVQRDACINCKGILVSEVDIDGSRDGDSSHFNGFFNSDHVHRRLDKI